MPILRLTVAPELQDQVREAVPQLSARLSDLVICAFDPAPGTFQFVVQESLAMPQGCPLLLEMMHRDTPARTPQRRAALADELAAALHGMFGVATRVRLIALDEAVLAASDVLADNIAEGERP